MKPKDSISSRVTYVLDTSALIAYLAQEEGGDRLKQLRSSAALPFIVLTELYYVVARKQGQTLADDTVHYVLAWHLPILTADERISLSAGYLKSQYQLGIADSYIAAFAIAHSATLVTKDSDFRILEPTVTLMYLGT